MHTKKEEKNRLHFTFKTKNNNSTEPLATTFFHNKTILQYLNGNNHKFNWQI